MRVLMNVRFKEDASSVQWDEVRSVFLASGWSLDSEEADDSDRDFELSSATTITIDNAWQTIHQWRDELFEIDDTSLRSVEGYPFKEDESAFVKARHLEQLREPSNWHHAFIDLAGARALVDEDALGKVRIGHPDTGYTEHEQFSTQLLDQRPQDRDPNRRWRGFLTFYGHGTRTGATLASLSGDVAGGAHDVVGAAAPAKILPRRVYRGPAFFTRKAAKALAKAIDESVENQCEVISISMGCPFSYEEVRRSIKRALDAGVIIVAASGQLSEQFPGGLIPRLSPGCEEGVITAAACGQDGSLVSWAVYRDYVDVLAPGVDIPVVQVEPTDEPTSWGDVLCYRARRWGCCALDRDASRSLR